MRIYKNRCRCAAAPDFLEDLAVRHLRKLVPAHFFRRSHTQHADPPETVDHVAWNVRLPIDLRRIEKFIEKVPKFFERRIKLRLFRRRDARIRHYPVRYEMPLEKSLGKPQRLRSRKKQLLSLLNLLLSFDVDLVHQKNVARRVTVKPRIVAMRPVLSNPLTEHFFGSARGQM